MCAHTRGCDCTKHFVKYSKKSLFDTSFCDAAPRGQKTCFACAQVDALVQFLEPLKSGTKGNFWFQNSCQTGYFSNFSHLVLYDPRLHAPKNVSSADKFPVQRTSTCITTGLSTYACARQGVAQICDVADVAHG